MRAQGTDRTGVLVAPLESLHKIHVRDEYLNVVFVWDDKNTPGQDRTGDLQRVRLTS